MPPAYSYLRFSSPQQAAGDSIRRQAQARESWLLMNPGVALDTSLVMTDAGRSAFKRKNWDTYALARFVDHIKSGRVEPGSYLLVENLDRLSREDAGEATELFLSIVNKGVVIVQLAPVVMEFRRPVNVQSLMFAIVELSRGHSESAMKSERGRAAWARKQREAGSRVVTRKLPGWVRYDNGKLVLDTVKAKAVRRMFALARDGYGTGTIAQKLNAEGVPLIGRTTVKGRPVAWSGTLVHHILTSRATIGEYVPYKRRGSLPNSGVEPVPNYFPPVVDQDIFLAVRGAITARAKVGRGRRGKHVNLFSGMLIDARDGGALSYWHGGPRPLLISVNAKEGRGTAWVSFPSEAFEAAILSRLVELRPSDIQGPDTDAVRRADVLAGRVAELDGLIKQWSEKMENPAIVDMVAAKLVDYSTKRKELTKELADARREAASPLPDSWGEFRSLAELLAKDNSDDQRTKVRAALRRSVESLHCLFVPGRRLRIAAVRVSFRGGQTHRDYLILNQQGQKSGDGARSYRPAITKCRSLAFPGREGEFDLRKPAHAAELATILAATDLQD